MALKAISRDKIRNYQSEFDPDKGTDKATVFMIGALTPRLSAKIRDKSTTFGTDGKTQEATVNVSVNSANIEFVRYGLRGWNNLQLEDGSLAEFTTEKDSDGVTVVSEKCIEMLSDAIIQELSREINDFNSLSEAQAKN